MWSFIARTVLRNRTIFLVAVALITVFMAYHATKIEMDYEYAALMPKDDPVYMRMQEFKERFGEDASLMVIGFKDKNFFEKEKFNDWISIQDTLKKFEGIKNILSVNDLVELQKDTTDKKFVPLKIFPSKIQTQKQLDTLSLKLKKYPFYKDLVYFDSSNVYLCALTWKKEYMNSKRREKLVVNIEKITNAWGKKHKVELRYSGLPYTRTKIALMIKKELGFFTVFAMLITALILYLFFRSFKVVFFSMLIVGISAVWALGTVHLFGYKITILTGMLPPLLIVIGIPNSVFLLNKFHAEYKSHRNKIKALHRVISKVGNATFLTNLTTAVGFATFIVTGNRLLVEFGVLASLNIMGVFVLSITLIPVFFSFINTPKKRHLKHLDFKLVNKVVDIFVYLSQKKRNIVYVSVAILLLIGIYGVLQVKSIGFIIDDIPEDNQVVKDLRFFEKNIGGVMPLEVSVQTKKKKGILKLSTLKKIEQFQEEIKKYPFISKSSSVVDAVKLAKQAFYNGNPKYYLLPSSQEKNFILSYVKNSSNNTKIAETFVDSNLQTARISMRVKDIGSVEMKKFAKNIDADLKKIFPEDKYVSYVTGSSIIFTQGTEVLVNNLFTSLGLAVILISVFMATMFSSFRMVVISLFPNVLPLIFTAAIMGFAGIPIKPSTVLVFSIAFGISVDNAIHFLTKYRQELIITKWDIKKSVIESLKETGISITYTATVLFFGFGIFTLSDFGGTVALGLLVAITLLFAMLSNLVLLPSLLLSLEKRITTKNFKDSLLEYEEEKS